MASQKASKQGPASKEGSRKRNLNFEIALLQAKAGLQPKIARCKKVVDASKKKNKGAETQPTVVSEELQQLVDKKRQQKEHHLRKTVHKTVKTGIAYEIRKLTKRLRSFKESLEKLQNDAQGNPKLEEVCKTKTVAVEKLNGQMQLLKDVDVLRLEKAVWEAAGRDEHAWDPILTEVTGSDGGVPGSVAHQVRVVEVRVLNSKAIASALPQLRAQRAELASEFGIEISADAPAPTNIKSEAKGANGAKAQAPKKATAQAKAQSAVAKLAVKKPSAGSGGDSSGLDASEDEAGSDDDMAVPSGRGRYGVLDDGRDSEEDFSGSEEEDGEGGISNDIFVSSLADMDSGEESGEEGVKPKKVKKRGSAKKQPKKKNRLGQHARRALAEKKFGSGAKHIQEGQAPMAKGKPTAAPRGGKFSAGKGPATGTAKANQSAAKNPAKTFPKRASAPKPAAPAESLHPSWEASKKRKQESAALSSFAGKKMKFDD